MKHAKTGGFTLIEMMIVVAIITVLTALMIPYYARERERAMLNSCMNNLMNISAANMRYANERDGHFPSELNELVPGYLAKIPICPSASTDTYTAGYEPRLALDMADDHMMLCAMPQEPVFKDFRISCFGNNHSNINSPNGTPYGENEPYYARFQGIGPSGDEDSASSPASKGSSSENGNRGSIPGQNR